MKITKEILEEGFCSSANQRGKMKELIHDLMRGGEYIFAYKT